ncbi:MAG: hypothetical protein AAGJ35_15270, partial [Myxococcota bacterium]
TQQVLLLRVVGHAYRQRLRLWIHVTPRGAMFFRKRVQGKWKPIVEESLTGHKALPTLRLILPWADAKLRLYCTLCRKHGAQLFVDGELWGELPQGLFPPLFSFSIPMVGRKPSRKVALEIRSEQNKKWKVWKKRVLLRAGVVYPSVRSGLSVNLQKKK